NGSYPSGHTANGWASALVMAEMLPECQDTILRRGFEYGQSRVIVGAHWQSDVDASRISAPIGLARLHTSPEFLKQLAKAQEEFARLTGKSTAGKTQKKSKAKK
ncbi:MAG: phosphatase PAP2 family protein, partial [Paludibacteraceae bacterium]|nr:phosphatase PAP2 family protein [Paludibacteraceae bacterium]